MTDKIKDNIKAFFSKYPEIAHLGNTTTLVEINKVERKILKKIPKWYIEILIEFPLSGLRIGIPNDMGYTSLKGKPIKELVQFEMKFYSITEIANHSLNSHPSDIMFKKGYIPIGEDYESTNEAIFINVKQNNPAPYMIWHEDGFKFKRLFKGADKLLDSFSDIFLYGKPRNEFITLKEHNKEKAVEQIIDFRSSLNKLFQKDKSNNHIENEIVNKINNSFQKFDDLIIKNEYIASLLELESLIHETKYCLNNSSLERLKTIYKTCGLHVPELVYIENEIKKKKASTTYSPTKPS